MKGWKTTWHILARDFWKIEAMVLDIVTQDYKQNVISNR